MSSFVRLALATTASLLLAAPALAGPAEERCTELGAACLCSEPLNFVRNGGNAYGSHVDPPDSEGAGARECGPGGVALQWDRDGDQWYSTPVPERPANASPAWQHVQAVEHYGPPREVNWWYGKGFSTQNGTACMRVYHNNGDLEFFTSPGQRLKVAQWHTPMLNQLEWDWGGSGYLRPQGGGGIKGNRVSFDDCRDSWCRIEYCLDYNGSTVQWRMRVTSVDNPSHQEVIAQPDSAARSLGSLSLNDNQVALGDIHMQCSADTGCLTGRRYLAYGMQTLIEPVNRNWWPGPAYEVEGGSGGAPAPPPTDGGGDSGGGEAPLGAPGRPFLLGP